MVVMNKTLWKDIKRLIRSTKGRFLSLTTIVLIGVSFFVGISSVSTIMGYSVDTYDDEVNLKDITIYSNYGFDEEDIDAIRTVSKGIEMYKTKENAVLIITHNTRILSELNVDYVHILVDGKIVKTGNKDLAKEIEEEGYEKYKRIEV